MDQITSHTFRQTMGRFPTGVTVVTAGVEDPVGVTIGSFVSISLDPPLVGFFLDVSSKTFALIDQAGSFCVNVLSDEQSELSNSMARPAEGDRFDGVEVSAAPFSGAPKLEGAVAVVDCSLERTEVIGDHWLIVGKVQAAEVAEGESLIFYQGQYGSFASLNMA